jgi:hypothetical protein
MDLAGRRVRSLEVGGLGRGRHVVHLERGPSLRSGVYLVRLSQGGRSVVAKTAVVR